MNVSLKLENITETGNLSAAALMEATYLMVNLVEKESSLNISMNEFDVIQFTTVSHHTYTIFVSKCHVSIVQHMKII